MSVALELTDQPTFAAFVPPGHDGFLPVCSQVDEMALPEKGADLIQGSQIALAGLGGQRGRGKYWASLFVIGQLLAQ
jgi:hypothetical protein